MTRHPLSAALLAAAMLAGVPASGFAQDDREETGNESSGRIGVQIISIGGENPEGVGTIWIGLDACTQGAEVEFRIDNFPSGKQLDVYVGPACNTADARDGEGDDCDSIAEGIAVSGTQDQRVILNARDIVSIALGADGCGAQQSKEPIWFLAVDSPGTTEAVDEDSYGSEPLNIDTDPPDAPTSIKGGRAENAIPVEWSVGNENVDSFDIYVDSGGTPIREGGVEPPSSEDDGGAEEQPEATGASNDMCGSGALRAGDSADNVPISLLTKSVRSATATRTTLSAAEVGGESAAVAVVALDEAGNRSPLSAVECVYVVPTYGFKDALGADVPQGCPCSAAGPAQLEGMLPIALALGFIAYRRRRRS
jgi:hypothetical protein